MLLSAQPYQMAQMVPVMPFALILEVDLAASMSGIVRIRVHNWNTISDVKSEIIAFMAASRDPTERQLSKCIHSIHIRMVNERQTFELYNNDTIGSVYREGDIIIPYFDDNNALFQSTNNGQWSTLDTTAYNRKSGENQWMHDLSTIPNHYCYQYHEYSDPFTSTTITSQSNGDSIVTNHNQNISIPIPSDITVPNNIPKKKKRKKKRKRHKKKSKKLKDNDEALEQKSDTHDAEESTYISEEVPLEQKWITHDVDASMHISEEVPLERKSDTHDVDESTYINEEVSLEQKSNSNDVDKDAYISEEVSYYIALRDGLAATANASIDVQWTDRLIIASDRLVAMETWVNRKAQQYKIVDMPDDTLQKLSISFRDHFGVSMSAISKNGMGRLIGNLLRPPHLSMISHSNMKSLEHSSKLKNFLAQFCDPNVDINKAFRFDIILKFCRQHCISTRIILDKIVKKRNLLCYHNKKTINKFVRELTYANGKGIEKCTELFDILSTVCETGDLSSLPIEIHSHYSQLCYSHMLRKVGNPQKLTVGLMIHMACTTLCDAINGLHNLDNAAVESIKFEKVIQAFFKKTFGAMFVTDQTLSKLNVTPTPDILFGVKDFSCIRINGMIVNWIEIKSYFIKSGKHNFLWSKLCQQMETYVLKFGNGALLCFGYQTGLAKAINETLRQRFARQKNPKIAVIKYPYVSVFDASMFVSS